MYVCVWTESATSSHATFLAQLGGSRYACVCCMYCVFICVSDRGITSREKEVVVLVASYCSDKNFRLSDRYVNTSWFSERKEFEHYISSELVSRAQGALVNNYFLSIKSPDCTTNPVAHAEGNHKKPNQG